MGRRAKLIQDKPEAERTPQERSVLSDFSDEQLGIRTITEVQTAIREKQTQAEQPTAVPAPDHGIIEQKVEKKAPVKHPVNKKPAIVKVKHGKKKNA
jgi:hypothetical protein